MSVPRIRVMIVDDAATIRSALKIMIRREPDMEVVGTAANGMDAVRMAADLKPDIILMDIEMPIMNGIEATEAIMDTNPVPVLIFSSVAAEAAPRTLEALDKGAVDFITKDGSSSAIDIGNLRDKILSKLREFARPRTMSGKVGPSPSEKLIRNRQRESDWLARKKPIDADLARPVIRTPGNTTQRRASVPMSAGAKTMRLAKAKSARGPVRIAVVAASTGGPQALQTLVAAIPASFPVPVVIVQHMPESFIQPFARRLGSVSKAKVSVGVDGEVLHPGHIYVAPGAAHTRLVQRGGLLVLSCSLIDVPGVLHKPSADVLFSSVAAAVGGECVAVVLTGMGRDGAIGAKALKDEGATVVAQDEASSVVYGMPRAVTDEGLADLVLPIEEIADAVSDLLGRDAGGGKS